MLHIKDFFSNIIFAGIINNNLFLGGPWAPFENSWHLKEEYKKYGRRQDLAQQLEKHILWVGIANLLLCPLILLWQILYSFFNYAEVTH